jgi:L-ascorbate metabolism protein UlaG (beta-lactamase superfamily)
MLRLGNLEIKWLGHSGFRISGEKTIYIDPYFLEPDERNADVILITHNHYDHCDKNKIKQLLYPGTHIIAAEGCENKLLDLDNKLSNKIVIMNSGDTSHIFNIKITAFPAYNTDKNYHPKGLGVGYIILFDGKKLYFAGDTDFIQEMYKLSKENIDIAFLPIGGTYTMGVREAANAVKAINPKAVVPMHYGRIAGHRKDAELFKKLVGNLCEVVIMD